MTQSKHLKGLGTLIGSLPVSEPQEALNIINEYTPQIPLWPQLPCNPQEGMLNQFIEGIPGIFESEKRTYFDLSGENFEQELLSFYEEYLKGMEDSATLLSSRFQVSPYRAQGIYDLKKNIDRQIIAAVKGQVTGPFTMLTGLSDKEHNLGYYNPQFREMLVKGLAMKGAWQVEFLKDLNVPVIVFIDEPALAALGSSAFISIAKEDVASDLSEVIGAIQMAGGLAGVHVCANTDWNFLLETNLDILSFDAYSYFNKLITCRDKICDFLDRDGTIAWGIVPTSDEENIFAESCDSLVALWEKQATMLEHGTMDRSAILERSLITPSCGTGAISKEAALKVMTLTRDVSNVLREKYLG